MNNNPIKVWNIPADLLKGLCKFNRLELYEDRLVGKGSRVGDFVWHFSDYIGISFVPAAFLTNDQYANIVFLTPEANLIKSRINQLVDYSRIQFCSGMYSYKRANEYAESVLKEIKPQFEKFKSNKNTAQLTSTSFSGADEILKFKNLLDNGIITEEEFEKKKQELL